jgi:hypothetical protein
MRSNRLMRRLAIGLAMIVLVAGCAAGTGAVTPRATASSPPGPATPTSETPARATPAPAATPLPEPTPILTPRASPRPSSVADLVVRLTWDSDVVAPIPGTTILDDGRVIWSRGDTIVERRLTEAGLAWVRAQLDETGLLRSNSRYGATLRPGATPDPRGVTSYAFRMESGGARVKVLSGDPGDYTPPAAWVVRPEMQVLTRLAHGLQDPEAWIDPAMWAGPAELFAAQAYLVIIDLASGPPAGGRYANDIGEVAWPFTGPITEVGAPFQQGGRIAENQRCLAATAEQVRAMADAEAVAGRFVGHSRDLDGWEAHLGYRWDSENANIVVTTRPLLPYQSLDCGDALAW